MPKGRRPAVRGAPARFRAGGRPAALATRKRGKRAAEAKAAELAMGTLVGCLGRLAELKGGTTIRIVPGNICEKRRLAMKGALDRRALGRPSKPRARGRAAGIRFVDSLSSEIVQAADGLACIINRHEGGDARFGGMFGDIERQAGRAGRPGA